MKSAYLLLLFILLAACMPEQQVRPPIVDESQDTSFSDDDNSTDLPAGEESDLFQSNINWFNSGLSSEILTINFNNSKTIYLLGDQVHNYLLNSTNFQQTYCLEARFNATSSTTPKILRVKVTPAYSNNFHLGQTTRFFRVNLNTDSGNSFCNIKSNETINGQIVSVPPSADIVNQTEDVCPDCLNILSSSQVVLYKSVINSSTGDYLERVNTTDITYEDLTLRLDMNGNSSSGSSSCSDTACQSNGFDCCVDGQCVNEKSIKMSGVQADQNGFAIAHAERYTNPNWFKNYPQFYYICLEQVPNDDGNDDNTNNPDPEDPVGDAQERLNELTADNECIKAIQNSSQATPFHRDAVNNTSVCTEASPTHTDTYETVFKRLYSNCGCSEANDLNTMVETCPAYTYNPIYQTDANGNNTDTILSFSCVTPPVDQVPGPFQDLDVIVNSRVAPHRFFDKNNNEITPGEPLPNQNVGTGEQEGDKFEYLDDFYIFPRNFDFNMNSILGEFNVNLTKAQPAKIVDVEFDKQYIISTLSGFYPGCPTCAKDSWFNNFSFAPTANSGVGLQPVGSTTRRDTYSTNLTLGNYEDTIFGRACWIPPTMIPYGHTENPNAQEQRKNRLKTQAALYVNGYQRDWFGFNRGALIGSFDGVTWFAIGKGRIVKSTSNKLFLAINAPFADLTTPTNHTVAVQEYDFTSSAPRFDYVPGLEINDAFQNEAGSCQKFHECETDSHCITKLGWEYVCADVTYNQTKWPQFNALGAVEVENTSFTGNIVQFLQQAQLPPDSSTKRCVYRGAGAPCRVDYHNISDEGKRKNLTCAPNFYCANVQSSNAFNTEVARFGRPLDELIESNNHLYGQEANILGRPKHYISTGNLSGLSDNIPTTILENVRLTDSGATIGNVGLCRPGKKLPDYNGATSTVDWEQTVQHQSADPLYRTDYISQIAGCNSALYTSLRYSSCPMLDESGNYIHTQDDFLDNVFNIPNYTLPQSQISTTAIYSYAQNSCGLESLSPDASIGPAYSADLLKDYSSFKTIEGFSLGNASTIIEPVIARDACLRKAGAVCHTDLDCSPNRLMASVVDLVNPTFFGNEAEKLYYEEYLVCGQAEREPVVGEPNFNTYTMHNNKCCRPIGADLTMYTEDSPAEPISSGLRTDTFGSLQPNNPNRYSRYSTSTDFIDSTTNTSVLTRPSANTEAVNHVLANDVNITVPNQWKTIHDSAAKTCCGGSWVRKFADGTNDWSKNRLNLDVNNFKCLNYNSPLPLTDNPAAFNMTSTTIDAGLNNYCADPTFALGGCVEQPNPGFNNDFFEQVPVINTTDAPMILYTNATTMASQWALQPWAYHTLIPTTGSAGNLVMNWTDTQTNADRRMLRVGLPSFITYNGTDDFDTQVTISMQQPNSLNEQVCTRLAEPADGYICSGANTENYGLCNDLDPWLTGSGSTDADGLCYYTFNENTRQLTAAFTNATWNNLGNFGDANNNLGLKIEYNAAGTEAWSAIEIDNTVAVDDPSVIDHRRSSAPGNAMYYLKRLAKLEYVGIPQMAYEPIYCNDNYQKLVPGIFQEEIQTVMDFLNHPRAFDDPDTGSTWASDSPTATWLDADPLNLRRATTSELLDQAPIFSDNKFKCCLELGSQTTDASMCCSGLATDDSGDPTGLPLFCKLPSGTDLNVYFNKFVSGEGISDKNSDTVLADDDFDPRTGEPKLTSSVLQKLNALGATFCASGSTRRGGVFGNFPVAPVGPLQNANGATGQTQYTIVDSIFDEGNINNVSVGYSWFNGGYRWNHHVYCGPPSN